MRPPILPLFLAMTLALSAYGDAGEKKAGDKSDLEKKAKQAQKQAAEPAPDKASKARGDTLLMTSVESADGKHLGDISGIVVNTKSGQVEYLVIGGGELQKESGAAIMPIPMDAFSDLSEPGKLMLNKQYGHLEEAPRFNAEAYKHTKQSAIHKQLASYYGEQGGDSKHAKQQADKQRAQADPKGKKRAQQAKASAEDDSNTTERLQQYIQNRRSEMEKSSKQDDEGGTSLSENAQQFLEKRGATQKSDSDNDGN